MSERSVRHCEGFLARHDLAAARKRADACGSVYARAVVATALLRHFCCVETNAHRRRESLGLALLAECTLNRDRTGGGTFRIFEGY